MKSSAVLLPAFLALSLGACALNTPFRGPDPVPAFPEITRDEEDLIVRPLDPAVFSDVEWRAWMTAGDRVFFELDKAEVSQKAIPAIQSKIDWLRRHPEIDVVVEGHGDDRGTRARNVALGRKRAEAAAAFLVYGGIDEKRIRISSQGKDAPVCAAKTEDCRAANRRAVFELLGRR